MDCIANKNTIKSVVVSLQLSMTNLKAIPGYLREKVYFWENISHRYFEKEMTLMRLVVRQIIKLNYSYNCSSFWWSS